MQELHPYNVKIRHISTDWSRKKTNVFGVQTLFGVVI